MKIVVTGAAGFLGRHLLPVLRMQYPNASLIGLSSQDYNLLDPTQVNKMFSEQPMDVLIHLAAYSGGIGANGKFPADFFYINNQLMALVFEAAAKHKIHKLIYTMGGCSYPAKARSPIDEGQMWDGYPQEESAGYSMAKKMGLVASRAYRQQHGLNSVVLVPGNMYGEYDNYRENESHVVPAMIRRYHEAKLAGVSQVTMWGSGAPQRDFVYASDVAAAIPYFIEHYNSSDPVNLSSGTITSIKTLAETVRQQVGYQGDIKWDTGKPDGQMVKIFDVNRLKSLGLSCPTSLQDGLRKTIAWFQTHYADWSDGLRL